MKLSYVGVSGICADCVQNGDDVECLGKTCQLRIIEEMENEYKLESKF